MEQIEDSDEYALPFVRLARGQLALLPFTHMRSRLWPQAAPLLGSSCWLSTQANVPAYLAWDWVLADDGLLHLLEPLAIRSNLLPLDADAQLLSAEATMFCWLAQVRRLPWREAVWQHALAHSMGEEGAAQTRMARSA